MLRTTISRRAPRTFNVAKYRTAPIHNMSLIPRLFQQELSPLLRLMDNYAPLTRGFDDFPIGEGSLFKLRTFQPRFDMSENEGAYTLHGELPGMDSKDIEVEWTDGNTLTVSGRVEQFDEQGGRPTAATANEAADTTSEVAKQNTTSGPPSPTVEDENPSDAEAEVEIEAVPATTAAETAQLSKTEESKGPAQEAAKANGEAKFWFSERSVGQFRRTFGFPTQVDQEGVKASLKNGILEIVVPKVARQGKRRIEVQSNL